MAGDRQPLTTPHAAPVWAAAWVALCGSLAGMVVGVLSFPAASNQLIVPVSSSQGPAVISQPTLRVASAMNVMGRTLAGASRQMHERAASDTMTDLSGQPSVGGVRLASAGVLAAVVVVALGAQRALKARSPEPVLAMISTTGATDTPKGVLLFPGQGTQFVGMAKDVIEKGGVGKALFDRASAVLGYDLAKLCLEGPEAQLNTTASSQPAVMVSSLAALEELKVEKPDLMAIGHVAGFSLGEITALVAAGALTLEDGLRVVKARAEAMQRSCELNPGGMGSITGLADEPLTEIIAEAVKETGGPLQVANYLFPEGRVVSGALPAVDAACAKAKAKGAAGASRLPVAGAFHTSFMAPAKEAVAAVLADVPVTLPAGRLLYSNVTATPYTSAEQIKALLVDQVVSPVQWERTAATLTALGGDLYEVGAGQQLKAMMKRIDKGGFKRTQTVGGWRPAK